MQYTTIDGYTIDMNSSSFSTHNVYRLNYNKGEWEIVFIPVADIKKWRILDFYWIYENAKKALAAIEARKAVAEKVYTTKDGFEITPNTNSAIHRVLPYEDKGGIQSARIVDVAPSDLHNWYWLHANALEAKNKRDAEHKIKAEADRLLKGAKLDIYDAMRYAIYSNYSTAMAQKFPSGGTVSGPQIAMVGDDPNRKETVTPGEWAEYDPSVEWGTGSGYLHDAMRFRFETFKKLADKKLAADKEHARIKSIVDFVDAQQLEFNTANAVVYAMTGKSKAELEKAVWYLQRAIAKL